MEASSADDFAAFGLTDKEHFSIFVQYPDLDFDPEADTLTDKMHDHSSSPESNMAEKVYKHSSSPESNTADHEEGDSFLASSSTAHTTPSKHPMFAATSPLEDEHTAFKTLLDKSDLPSITIDYFRSLGQQVFQLGGLVQHLPSDPFSPEFDLAVQCSSRLHSQLSSSLRSTTTQTSSIDSLVGLTAFAVTPTDLTVWPTYRQRIQLITRHLSLPALTERKLLDSLLALFDAYIYNPFLHLTSPDSHTVIPADIRNAIHNLYDAICNLVTEYHKWLTAMRDLKSHYLTPLVVRIEESTFIQREIEQSESIINSTRAALESGSVTVPREYTTGVVAGAVRLGQARNRNAAPTINGVGAGTSTNGAPTGDRAMLPTRDEARTRRWRRQMTV